MTTSPPDKSESESSSSIEMTPSPGSTTTTTESTTTGSPITGSTTNGSITDGSSIDESITAESAITRSTTHEFTSSESIDTDSSDGDSTDSEPMATQRTDAQWYELREGWTLHRFEEQTEFQCHQCNRQKRDILVAMKPEKNWDNMCCNACFCLDIGPDSDHWNLVHVDGIDHIW